MLYTVLHDRYKRLSPLLVLQFLLPGDFLREKKWYHQLEYLQSKYRQDQDKSDLQKCSLRTKVELLYTIKPIASTKLTEGIVKLTCKFTGYQVSSVDVAGLITIALIWTNDVPACLYTRLTDVHTISTFVNIYVNEIHQEQNVNTNDYIL